jgi:hypothetical protein
MPKPAKYPRTRDELFAGRVDMTGDCWVWTKHKAAGYGRFGAEGKEHYAHRASYEIHNGPIPEGMQVCHTCDNPACVKPEHLFLGTARDNMRDKTKKGRNGVPGGGDSNLAKLTWEEASMMRKLSRRGESTKGLARQFKVAERTARDIIAGKTYRV